MSLSDEWVNRLLRKHLLEDGWRNAPGKFESNASPEGAVDEIENELRVSFGAAVAQLGEIAKGELQSASMMNENGHAVVDESECVSKLDAEGRHGGSGERALGSLVVAAFGTEARFYAMTMHRANGTGIPELARRLENELVHAIHGNESGNDDHDVHLRERSADMKRSKILCAQL